MTDFNTRSIIDFASASKPVDLTQAFNDVIGQKLNAAIADKRIEVASQLFNGDDEDSLERVKAAAEPEDELEQDDDELAAELDGLTEEELEELGLEDWAFEDDNDNTEEE